MDPIEQELFTKYGVDPSTHRLDRGSGEFVPIEPSVATPARQPESVPWTIGRRLAGQALPVIAGSAAAIPGAIWGTAAGEAVAPQATPFSGIAGGAVGGAATGLAGTVVAGMGQHYLANKFYPQETQEWNEQEAVNEQAHPWASKAADLGSMLLGNKFGLARNVKSLLPLARPGALSQAAKQELTHLGANVGTGVGISEGQAFDRDKPNYGLGLKPALEGLGVGLALGGPRAPVRALANKVPGINVKEQPPLVDELEAPRKALTAGKDIEPVPEQPGSISEQLKDAVDPLSTRKAVLITEGETFHPELVPPGFETAETSQGTVLFNPKKGLTAKDIKKVAKGGDFPGTWLGMSQNSKPLPPLTIEGQPKKEQLVVSTFRNGHEVLSEVVNDNPADIARAKAAHLKAVPGGKTLVTEVGQVLDHRLLDQPVTEKAPTPTPKPETKLDDLPLFVPRTTTPPKPLTPPKYDPTVPRQTDFIKARAEEALAKIPRPINLNAGTKLKPLSEVPYEAKERQIPIVEDVTPRTEIDPELTKPISEAEQIQEEYDSGLRRQSVEEQTPPVIHPKIKQGWMDFWKRTALRKYATQLEQSNNAVDESGAPVKGKVDINTRKGEVDTNRATNDTPGHEVFHVYFNDLLKNGTAGEKAFLQRALKQFGGSEEKLTQAIGKGMIERLAPGEDKTVRDVLDFIRYKLGNTSEATIKRLGSNMMWRGRGSRELGMKAPGEEGYKPQSPIIKAQQPEEGEASENPTSSEWSPIKNATDIIQGPVNALRNTDTAKNPAPWHRKVADAWNTTFKNRREYNAEFSKVPLEEVAKLTPDQQEVLWNHLYDEHENGKLSPPPDPALQDAYDAFHAGMDAVGQERRNLGMMVMTPSGRRRQGGLDPTYFPHVEGTEARKLLSEQQGSPEIARLKSDYIKQNMARFTPTKTVTAQDYLEALNTKWDSLAGSNMRRMDKDNAGYFRALRLAEGAHLPKEMVEKNLSKLISQYFNRSASDMAFYKNFEKNPEMQAAIGLKLDPNIPSLASNEHVQNIVDSYFNTHKVNAVGKAAQNLGTATSVGIVSNPITRLADLIGSVGRSIGYTNPQDVPKMLAKTLVELGNHPIEQARRTGGIRSHNTFVDNTIAGIEQANELVKQGVHKFSQGTGSEMIERWSRGWGQASGRAILGINGEAALRGEKTALKFMDSLGTDWRELLNTESGQEKLATRIMEIQQGSYDVTNEPKWATEGGAKAFVSLARWSIEQQNNFKKYQIAPLLEDHNPGPLLSYIVGVLGAGAVIQGGMKQYLSARKSFEPTWDEIEKAPDKERAKLAATAKIMNMAQAAGMFGFTGGLVNNMLQLTQGQQFNQFQAPAAKTANDVIEHTAKAMYAIAQGEDFKRVMSKLLENLGTSTISSLRLLRNWYEKDKPEGKAADARRDYSVFKRLSGDPIASFRPSPSYSGLDEQEYDKADLDKALPILQESITRQAQNDPSRLPEKLKSLKSIANTQEGPSFDNDLVKFSAYIDYIRKTQGEESAQELTRRLVTGDIVRGIKRDIVP